MTERIPVAGPWITEKEVRYVTEAVSTAWYQHAGDFHRRFETAFAAAVRRRFALSLPSCTAGLHLCLAALGVGPGDEVIVPDLTWIATSAPVGYVGAVPVFADVDPESWCLSADAFERCITGRTRAAILVDLYGAMPEMDAILAIAARRGIPVIEDAAEAIGSEYRGAPAGSFGRASCFSFHGSKTLTTGEGGMLVTDDGELYERCLFLRDHGRPPGDRYFCNTEVAFKYRMSAMQAALGLAQLERVRELVDRKREIHAWYREGLAGLEGVAIHGAPDHVTHSYWMVTVLLDPALGLTKLPLMEALDRRGIDSRPLFHPLSSLPAYADTPQAVAARSRNDAAYRLSPYGVNLPSALSLTREQVERVCAALRECLAARGAR